MGNIQEPKSEKNGPKEDVKPPKSQVEHQNAAPQKRMAEQRNSIIRFLIILVVVFSVSLIAGGALVFCFIKETNWMRLIFGSTWMVSLVILIGSLSNLLKKLVFTSDEE